MPKRKIKFKITFNKTTEEVTCNSNVIIKSITEIKVNGDVVGHIYPPKYSTHATDSHHIVVLVRVTDNPVPKTLKPIFDTAFDAREFVRAELYNIHKESNLYIENSVPNKHKKVKFGEDW